MSYGYDYTAFELVDEKLKNQEQNVSEQRVFLHVSQECVLERILLILEKEPSSQFSVR